MSAVSHHQLRPDQLPEFLALSATLTAFSEFELQGTGQAQAYLATVVDIVGGDVVGQLLGAHEAVRAAAGDDEAARDRLVRVQILSDGLLGPIARNLMKLWYVGTWYCLPREWTDAFGARDGDRTFVVSPTAYTEGLVWPAIGANPPGAKGPGYGTWAAPPRIAAI